MLVKLKRLFVYVWVWVCYNLNWLVDKLSSQINFFSFSLPINNIIGHLRFDWSKIWFCFGFVHLSWDSDWVSIANRTIRSAAAQFIGHSSLFAQLVHLIWPPELTFERRPRVDTEKMMMMMMSRTEDWAEQNENEREKATREHSTLLHLLYSQLSIELQWF